MAGRQVSLILLYGDEDFLIDRVIYERRAAWHKYDLTLMFGDKVTEVDVVSLCETRSMFDSSTRAIIVDSANEMKLGEDLKTYIEERDPDDVSSLLMLVLRNPTIPAPWAAISKKAHILQCLKPKPWEAEKIRKAVLEEGRLLNLKLEDSAADALISLVGYNLRTIANDLKKLSYLVPAGTAVTRDHVMQVVSRSATIEPYQVAEAVLAKNLKLALARISLIYKNMGDEASVPITAALIKQVERAVLVRYLLDKGASAGDIARRIEMNEFSCKKNVLPVVQRHTTKALLGHLNGLCKLESDVKGAARSKRTLVELAVLDIASA